MTSLVLFRNSFIIGISFLFLTTFVMLFHFFFITPKDFANYAAIKELKIAAKQGETEQTSRGVRKDLFFVSDGKRLHHTIRSSISKLTFSPKGHHHEVTERMENLSGEMQEAGSTIRRFKALRGLYHYGSHSFNAESATLRLIQSLPVEKVLLEGKASSMEMHMSVGKPYITVKHLVATMPDSI